MKIQNIKFCICIWNPNKLFSIFNTPFGIPNIVVRIPIIMFQIFNLHGSRLSENIVPK